MRIFPDWTAPRSAESSLLTDRVPPGFGKNDGWGFLGTGHPVIQAPMAGVEDGKLTAVVSSAGAVGSLASAVLSLERLR